MLDDVGEHFVIGLVRGEVQRGVAAVRGAVHFGARVHQHLEALPPHARHHSGHVKRREASIVAAVGRYALLLQQPRHHLHTTQSVMHIE